MKLVLFTTSDMRSTRRSALYKMLASTAGGRDGDIAHYLLLQNCTADDEADVSAHAPAWTRITSVPGRLSISAARNRMLQTARSDAMLENGSVVAFPDDDCWYPPLLLNRLKALFEGDCDLDVLLTPCSLDPDGADFAATDGHLASAREIVRKSSSNTMFIRGDLVGELGGFNEALGLGTPSGGGEDTDYALRAYLRGRRSVYLDRAIVGHAPPTPDSAAKYYRGALMVLALHARQRGEVRREFMRKLAVGGYFLMRRKLSLRTYLHSLIEMTRIIRNEGSAGTPPTKARQTALAPGGPDTHDISLLYCVDGAYLNQACVSLTSVLASNPHTPIHVTIAMLERVGAEALRAFCRVLDPYPHCSLRFRNIDLSTFAGLPTTARFSASIYARIVLARFMDGVHKRVLYLDADTIVQSDLRPLWTQDLQGKAVAAVRDRFRLDMEEIGFGADEPYFNSGVILFDMAAWRERQYETRVLDLIQQQGERMPWMDQDALNMALRGDVAFVDNSWNFQPRCADVPASFLGLTQTQYRTARIQPCIIHYTTSMKPWNAAHKVHYSDRFFKMARRANLQDVFAPARPRSLAQRREQLKTWMRWRFPRLFRWVRTTLRPEAASLMYRSR